MEGQAACCCSDWQDLRVAEIAMRFNRAWLLQDQPEDGDMPEAQYACCVARSNCGFALCAFPMVPQAVGSGGAFA